jgi:hypothetical protein
MNGITRLNKLSIIKMGAKRDSRTSKNRAHPAKIDPIPTVKRLGLI